MRSFIHFLSEYIPEKKVDIFGKGGWLMTCLPYFLLVVIIGLAYNLIWENAWVVMVIIYLLLPYLDQLFTLDLVNPTENQRRQLQNSNFYFKLPLYTIIIVDWIFFYKMMYYFQSFQFTVNSCFNLVALIFVFSNLNTIQFAVAHQIFHKQGTFNKVLGTLHMSKNFYMHFTYQHLYGHHRNVATQLDPASADQGINFYQFFPKTFFGSYKNVYKMQKEEEKKPFYLNYAVLSIVGAFAFTAAIYYIFGPQATIFFLIEAFGTIFYLEAINYIEHYGLRRKKLSNGQYQKVNIRHSWNAPHRITNYILFKLQRHSDHHENSLKPYQTLLSLEQSPHLPHGYSLMILMAFFPSIWYKVMDPLVQEYKKSGVGTIKNEVTLKSLDDTRKFLIEIGGVMLGFSILNWVI